jgi:superfamily II DNA or RNA helicase
MDGKTFKKQELKQVADNCRIILGTYGMIGRGTDIPRLSALVLATPQVDLRQVKGRIERAMPGKQQPVVIDIVDSYYFMLHNAGNARVQQYRETNMEVRLME